MTTVLIDFDVGNLHSAQKAFERMARETDAGPVVVSAAPDVIAAADRLVLPGDGAFPACWRALHAIDGLAEALRDAVDVKARPLMGICVGMQMLARKGFEYEETPGFGWIDGEIHRITPSDPAFKIPHMGWNDLIMSQTHPVSEGVATGDHAYFVHSWAMRVATPDEVIATCDYGGPVTAIVGKDTVIGTQFHPEKSQATGLRLISNFLRWAP